MSAGGKEEILSRIRRALGAERGRSRRPVPRMYRQGGQRARRGVLDLFEERVSDYQASVVRCREKDLPHELATALARMASRRVAIPPDLPERWLVDLPVGDVELLRDGEGDGGARLSRGELASCYGVLTACALGIAETGTLVLDGGPGQGRRALSLLPDHHLCVVFSDQVVETVPEAVRALESKMNTHRRPFTLVSGPSATSDIELIRVEGVHGPRNLDVVLVEEG